MNYRNFTISVPSFVGERPDKFNTLRVEADDISTLDMLRALESMLQEVLPNLVITPIPGKNGVSDEPLQPQEASELVDEPPLLAGTTHCGPYELYATKLTERNIKEIIAALEKEIAAIIKRRSPKPVKCEEE